MVVIVGAKSFEVHRCDPLWLDFPALVPIGWDHIPSVADAWLRSAPRFNFTDERGMRHACIVEIERLVHESIHTLITRAHCA